MLNRKTTLHGITLVVATGFAIGNIAALGELSAARSAFVAGQHNLDIPYIVSQSDERWLLIWLLSFPVLITGCVLLGARSRAFAAGCLCMCLAALPLSCRNRSVPVERYVSGLSEWTALNVDSSNIASWFAGQPAVRAAAIVPASSWPGPIAGLVPAPKTVVQLPNGVVMEWRRLAAWGNSRRVFVGLNKDSAPPHDNPLYLWTEIRGGTYVSYQVTD